MILLRGAGSMGRGFIDRLDAPVADALASMSDSRRQLEVTVAELMERGRIDRAAASGIADYFERSGALESHEKWRALQRRLDDHARSTATDGLWQGDAPFVSKLDHGLTEKRARRAALCFSAGARRAILSRFDAAAVPFFELYADLRRLEQGAAAPGPLMERLRQVVLALTTSRSRSKGGRLPPGVMNRIYDQVQALGGLFEKLEGTRSADCGVWEEVGRTYRGLVVEVAKREDVHLAEVPATSSRRASVRRRAWANLRLMTAKERARCALREAHPELHEQKEFQRRAYGVIDAKLVARIVEEGMEPKRARVLGRLVRLGTKDGETYVFDHALEPGEPAPTLRAWCRARRRDLAARRRLVLAEGSACDPARLRTVLPKTLRVLAKEQPSPEYVALSDDRAKQNGHTRIFPTRWVDTGDGILERVIVGGRFEGVLVNDMVLDQGRMIEGTAFRVQPAGRGGVQVPTRVDPSRWEPYLTVGEVRRNGRVEEVLMAELPGARTERWTSVRRAMRRLSRAVPEIRYVEGSRNRAFSFEPRYFEAVREALGGSLLLSAAAHRKLGRYFQELTSLNTAMAQDNLGFYAPAAIGGFRSRIIDPSGRRRPLSFHAVQQRILARLEANDNRGVVGLGTGGGKTLVAIAMMQKLIRDGIQAERSNNGRFLFICPEGHAGNVRAEIRKFLKQKDASFLDRHLDVIEYPELARAEREERWQGRRFQPSAYVAIFFDEAQALKNDKWVATRAAYRIDHPRKILMTASVMDKADPREVYNLVQIANNVDMTNPREARAHWRERRKFEVRYAERVGGVVVGPTADPVARQEYEAWVNKNVQYIDKTRIPEAPLPPLTRQTLAVKMNPAIEQAYRRKLHRLKVPIRGAIALHADRGRIPGTRTVHPSARDKRARSLLNGGHRDRVTLLDCLANTPWKIYPRAGAASPKVEAAVGAVLQRLEETDSASRAVLFHERDRDLLLTTAKRLSEELPGKIHAVGLRREVRMFCDGEELEHYGPFDLPFTRRPYRVAPNEEESADNPAYDEGEWRQFVLDNVIKPDRDIMTVSLEAQQYGTGLNMQHAFDTVIHFDRVDAEKMNQRLGRVWRHGQVDPVKEITIDVVLSGRRDKYFTTLDDMRRQVQENQEQIFDDMIIKPQEAVLGGEWIEMQHLPASMLKLRERIATLLSTPAARGIRPPTFLKTGADRR